jgi:hypothetical protein
MNNSDIRLGESLKSAQLFEKMHALMSLHGNEIAKNV